MSLFTCEYLYEHIFLHLYSYTNRFIYESTSSLILTWVCLHTSYPSPFILTWAYLYANVPTLFPPYNPSPSECIWTSFPLLSPPTLIHERSEHLIHEHVYMWVSLQTCLHVSILTNVFTCEYPYERVYMWVFHFTSIFKYESLMSLFTCESLYERVLLNLSPFTSTFMYESPFHYYSTWAYLFANVPSFLLPYSYLFNPIPNFPLTNVCERLYMSVPSLRVFPYLPSHTSRFIYESPSSFTPSWVCLHTNVPPSSFLSPFLILPLQTHA